MRQTFARLFGAAVLIGFASVIILTPGGRVQAAPDYPECEEASVANYIGTTCFLPPAVIKWNSYSCTSTPESICEKLGENGKHLEIRRDRLGPHTLLIGNTDRWNVKSGQSVDVIIKGYVSGASVNLNWPHFHGERGQTGDGTEENITSVSCGSDCTALEGVSDVLCSAEGPPEYCEDQHRVGPFMRANATFNPATEDRPYPFFVEVKMNGGSHGTASLYSVGIHLGIPGGGGRGQGRGYGRYPGPRRF